MRHRPFKSLILGMLALCLPIAGSVQAENLKQDPAWLQGKLDNGFHWQILSTPHRSTDRIEINLTVNTGSLQESSTETGYARLLAHLLTEQTAHFPPERMAAFKNKLAEKSNSAPNRPWVLLGYSNTEYRLSIPNSRPELLKEAIEWLADVANSPQIDAETYEEAKMSASQASVEFFPANLSSVWWKYRIIGSPLVYHAPDKALAVGANAERLSSFYQQWYTPDAMKLHIIGNVERRAVEEQINKSFSAAERKRASPAILGSLNSLPDSAVALADERHIGQSLMLIWDRPWLMIKDTQTLDRYWLQELAREVIFGHLEQKMARSGIKNSKLKMACNTLFHRDQCTIQFDGHEASNQAAMRLVAAEMTKLRKSGLTEEQFNALIAMKKEHSLMTIADYARMDTQALMQQHLSYQMNGLTDLSPESYQQHREQFLTALTQPMLNNTIDRRLSTMPVFVSIQKQAKEGDDAVDKLGEIYRAIVIPEDAASR